MNEHPQAQRLRTPIKVALGTLVLVAVIAVSAQFVRSDDAADADRSIPGPVPTSGAGALATPTAIAPKGTAAPSPTAPPAPMAPTPVIVPDSPAGHALPAPTPRPAPTTPKQPYTRPNFDYSEAVIVEGYLVAPDNGGVWIREHQQPRWRFVHQPQDLLQLGCPAAFGDQLGFTTLNTDRTSQYLAMLNPSSKSWTVSQLPRLDEDDQVQPRPNFCEGIMVGDQWVFGVAHRDELFFAISSDHGATFTLRSVQFPDSWSSGPLTPNSTYVDLVAGSADFVADMCVFYDVESRCGVTAIRIDGSALINTDQSVLEWDEVASLLGPSPRYGGGQGLDIAGVSPNRVAFGIDSVGGELWRSEMSNRIDTIAGPVDDYEVGNWAAGPVDQPPIPLPLGFRPMLYPYGPDVLARVSLQPITEFRPLPVATWRLLKEGSREWVSTESPVVEWDSLPLGTPVSLVHAAGWSVQVIPLDPPPQPATPWDNEFTSYGGELAIAGDTITGVRLGDLIWTSTDRGATWNQTPLEDDSYYYEGGYFTGQSCLSTDADQWAATIRSATTQRSLQLAVVDPQAEGLQFFTLLASPWDTSSDSHFAACRPLNIDGRWLVANADLAERRVTITSVDAGAGAVTHQQISLPSDWIDRIGPISFYGSVNLFLDDDVVQVQLCGSAEVESVRCKTTIIEVDLALLDGRQSLIDPESSEYLGLVSLRPGGTLERPERLSQVGSQTWRSVAVEEAGQFAVAERGQFPYFNWTSGPLGGTQAPLPLRNHRLFEHNGQVLACGESPDDFEAEPFSIEREQVCWVYDQEQWSPFLGNAAVDWSTVPAGTAVTFSHRTDDGRLMVIAKD